MVIPAVILAGVMHVLEDCNLITLYVYIQTWYFKVTVVKLWTMMYIITQATRHACTESQGLVFHINKSNTGSFHCLYFIFCAYN